MEAKPRAAIGARVAGYLRAHPVISLLILTPGIPEYLSSSSPINAIIFNPPQFIFQLLANLGLYGSGVLLIHDARIRWNKGWASVLLLGAAYGILEEGVALSTLFDPAAGPVGSLGVYGHWLGVNWVWAAGIVPFHAIFSISIPILLLGMAVPETELKPLLSSRGTVSAFLVMSVDVAVLMVVVWRLSGYWMGWPILVLSLATICGLVYAAHQVVLPSRRALAGRLSAPPRQTALVGLSFFPAVILTQSLGRGAGLPAPLDLLLVVAVQALYLPYLSRRWPDGSERSAIAFVLGLLLPIMALGVLAELAFPMTILADLAVLVFFRKLWIGYKSPREITQTVNLRALADLPVKGGVSSSDHQG